MQPERPSWESHLKDPGTERLLVELLKRRKELSPSFDPAHGYRYPDAENLCHVEAEEARSTLERLTQAGLLEKKFHTMDIACPSCGSSNIATAYVCESCRSPMIVKNALTEHTECGYIDSLPKFKSEDRRYVCPKCGTTLRMGDLRIAGTWFECSSCGKRVPTVLPVHSCRACGEKFSFERAVYYEVDTYAVNANAAEAVGKRILTLAGLKELLAAKAYALVAPGSVTGRSAVQHWFDLVATKEGGKKIAVETADSKELSSQKITEWFGKVADSEGVETFFVILGKVPGSDRETVEAYGLNVVYAEEPEGAVAQIVARLEARGSKDEGERH